MTLSRRRIWLLTIVLLSLLLVSLFLAPSGGNLRQGSTYARSPDGYAAWYAYMEKRGMPIQRWEKPVSDLTNLSQPVTLLQISDSAPQLSRYEQLWVSKGNVLVLLGVKTPATRAPFSSQVSSPVGVVQIETSRRAKAKEKLLADSFGAIVWHEAIGKGKVIYASTRFLGANAYQNVTGNFPYLAKLVTEAGNPIYVDEYQHGYKDADVLQKESSGNVFTYLAKTPLSLLALQTVVILGVLLLGLNQRLGRPITLTAPTVDNSEDYIQAMAGVLRKANCSDFALDTLRKAEQSELQKGLGLGSDPLPLEVIAATWTQQTGKPATALEALFKPNDRKPSAADLLKWLDTLKSVKQEILPKG